MIPTVISARVLRLLLPVCLAACATWRVTSVPPQELFGDRAPERIRVTRTDSTVLTLAHPTLSDENLVGTRGGTSITVPLGEVSRLELPATDVGATLILVGTVVGLAVGFFVIAHNAAGS